MTHRYFQTVAGADDTSAGDATELKWGLDEDLDRCCVSFPVDQSWCLVGTIGDLAFGVVFLYFGSVVVPFFVLWMMYGLFMYCVKWRL